MKNYLALILIIFGSANAMADRTVFGVGGGNPMGISKASACSQAKSNAANKASGNEQVASYSPCECEKNDQKSRELPWSCSVDARLGKKD